MLFQFSKDKYLLESPPEKLRKELEEELKLSAADIRSHGWYHGHIPREVSAVDLENVCAERNTERHTKKPSARLEILR